jgi:phenylpropionate dioxygenase-like ring-hydroxylating dioxygenase large terminal subunit
LHGLIDRLREAVRPAEGIVPGFVHSDPDVYRLEMERVFQRCWLFVAHESEVPAPGDYVTRAMGEQPVVVARGEDGRVRVFLNVCRHRGMRVCRSDAGNASHFRCPYHGFTYRNDGALIGVPFQRQAYGDGLDKQGLGLVEARVDSYAGLIFATWDPGAGPLGDYLSGMRWYLDLLVGRAEMEVVGPPQRYLVETAWKLPSENFASDAYHTAHTHASIAKIGLVPGPTFSHGGYHIHAGNGHGLGLGQTSARPVFAEEVLPEIRGRLTPEQYGVLERMNNLHGNLFPNLSFLISSITHRGRLISHTTMHQFQPKGPDRTEVHSWFLVERDAPDEWKERSRQAYILTFGTSGIFAQDDAENFADITAGSRGPLAARLSLSYAMGLGRETAKGFPGPGEVYEGKYCEANARAFYARWLELMLGVERE